MKVTKKQKSNHLLVDYLIIGTGNIAKRHIQNILEKRPKCKFLIYKRTDSKHDEYFDKNRHLIINTTNDICPIDKQSAAIICSPASHHSNDIKRMLKKGFHIFVEKPFLIKTNHIKPLIQLSKIKKKVTQVGFNMRYTKRLLKMKQILKNNTNAIRNVKIKVFTDFRTWRKNKDFKSTVTFNRNLGGGVINELSHEVDYLVFLFGKPTHVKVNNILNQDIQIDVEHHIESIFWYKNLDLQITLEANMLAKNNKRICEVNLDNTKIKINHLSNIISITDKKIKNIKFDDDINFSYQKEISHFFKSIKNNAESELSFAKCIDTQNILNAMHSSLENNKKIRIQ